MSRSSGYGKDAVEMRERNEDVMFSLARAAADLEIAALRVRQAIARKPDLADLLEPAEELINASISRIDRARGS